MKIQRVSKGADYYYLAGKFKFVPDPNIVCTRLVKGIGSEARTKMWSYGKADK